ncbi:hypothetical protein KC19_5G027600 [Ceratodon purpureus]|uniref:Uncharacterized protein n=1 Tax=Ceratodon purpureus TaxID=3225 RepID=A0A8T0HY01_CERPU|nr:hypothetical protein KC19_5G027600 [Ceratodon purpureus]
MEDFRMELKTIIILFIGVTVMRASCSSVCVTCLKVVERQSCCSASRSFPLKIENYGRTAAVGFIIPTREFNIFSMRSKQDEKCLLQAPFGRVLRAPSGLQSLA